jgi:hypothetical protein
VSVEFPAGFWFIQEIRLHHGLLDRYPQRNEDLFSLGLASGCFKTDGVHELVRIVNDLLIEPIKLATLLVLEFAVAGDGRQQTGGQGRVDPFEQLEEDEADGVAFAQQAVAPGTRNSLHQSFGAELRKDRNEGMRGCTPWERPRARPGCRRRSPHQRTDANASKRK